MKTYSLPDIMRGYELNGNTRVDSFTLDNGTEIQLMIDWFHGHANYKVQARNDDQHAGWKTMGSYGPKKDKATSGFEMLKDDLEIAEQLSTHYMNK